VERVARLDDWPFLTSRRVRRGDEVLLLGERLALLVDAVRHDHDPDLAALVSSTSTRTADLGEGRGALRVPRLEDLDDAREAVRDVRAGDAAGVERPHRQLRARLADRLRGDDPDRVADLGHLAGGEERCHSRRGRRPCGLALQHERTGSVVTVSPCSPSSEMISRRRGMVSSSPRSARSVLPGFPEASGLWMSSQACVR